MNEQSHSKEEFLNSLPSEPAGDFMDEIRERIRLSGRKVVVVGKAADDIGQQCGGWTISGQGDMGATTKGT